MPKSAFFQAVPFLLVDDVARSGEHWQAVLGFNPGRFIGDTIVVMTRNAARVTLRRIDPGARPVSLSNAGRQPGAVDLYISVSDIDAYAAELGARGADLVQLPDAAARELKVRDCNDYILCFGEEQNWPY
jgi:hypothetical protein